MALRKMRCSKKNVYVYDGKGAEKYSKLHLLHAFQEVLDGSYDVSFISPKEIIEGLWVRSAAAIAFGGGFDCGFKETLGSDGVKVIKAYVANGGKYLGICAGGYFACEQIEFDKNGPLEVCGKRELGFFQGICKGPVYPGFMYGSFKGSVSVSIELHLADIKSNLDVFYHGGGCFIPATNATQDLTCTSNFREASVKRMCTRKFQEHMLPNEAFLMENNGAFHSSVRILGRYSGLESKPPAIVQCFFGKGIAILSGVHIEYYSNLLDKKDTNLENIISTLACCEKERLHCFKLLMKKLLLKVV